MTFSVLARDAVTGDLGIAVSSCILAVGRAVPTARPGVGIVAVQARSRRGLGSSLLAGLADGGSPEELVRRAAHAAEDAERQIAVLGVDGAVAADTGPGAFPVSGHLVGERLQRAGQHARRRRACCPRWRGPSPPPAATSPTGCWPPWPPGRTPAAICGGASRRRCWWSAAHPRTTRTTACGVDLRVDDSGDPVAQLRMLRNLQRAYDEGDYETLAVFAPVGARDLYAALAASRRGDRQAARAALDALRSRPGWSVWLASMAGDPRISGVSRLLGGG